MPELTVAHPEWLWVLVALPVLLVLLLPPRPRRVQWTAHLPQWRLALAGLKRKPPRAFSLRTLLLLLAAACVVLAVLGLSVRGVPGPTRLVVALDGSASMAARTAATGGSALAFGRVTDGVREQLADLPDHVEVTLLRCGGTMLRRHGPSARALHDLGDAGGALDVDFVELARGLEGDDVVLWTVTDGQGQTALPAAGALTLVGAQGVNAAVLEVRVEDHWPLPGLAVEADVVAYGGGALEVQVSVTGAVSPVPVREVRLRPGEPRTLSWALSRHKAGGVLAVAIATADDALASDDRWTAALPPLPAPRIAVLTGEDAGPFAPAAAAALAAEVGGEVVEATSGEPVGLLLVDGGEVAIAPGTARVLSFGSRLAGSGDRAPWPRIGAVDWDRTASLTAGLDLSELRVDRAFGDCLPANGEPFLFGAPFGDRQPLAVVCATEELTSIHFAFRLRDGNLPLLPAFPQLLRRAFVRSYGEAARIVATSAVPAPGEQDLWRRATADDRPLPAFGTPDRELGSWLMLAGLLCLALRIWLR